MRKALAVVMVVFVLVVTLLPCASAASLSYPDTSFSYPVQWMGSISGPNLMVHPYGWIILDPRWVVSTDQVFSQTFDTSMDRFPLKGGDSFRVRMLYGDFASPNTSGTLEVSVAVNFYNSSGSYTTAQTFYSNTLTPNASLSDIVADFQFSIPAGSAGMRFYVRSSTTVTSGGVPFAVKSFVVTDITSSRAIDIQAAGVEEGLNNVAPSRGVQIPTTQSPTLPGGAPNPDFTEDSLGIGGWASQVREYADQIEIAGEDVKDLIRKGTSITEWFLGGLPVIVMAVISFVLVVIVIRKVVGR